MAEAVIVNIVVGKLANIIAKEIQFLGGVGEKVKKAQRELVRIQSCLRDADSKRKRDERVQNWLNELRDVAYRIEDAIDMFFLKVNFNKNHSFWQKLKKLLNMPLQMHFRHKLGTELDSIQIELEEISKSRVNYGIIALQDIAVGEPVILPVRRATYSEVDETEVVGLHADRDNILKFLRCEETPRRAVITIVGTGGIGKTTLAHMIYKSSKAKFEYHIMLSVSQQFNLTELLKKMLRQLIDDVPMELDVEDLMSELKKKISSRRYLIILDDVWQVGVWNQLKGALPDDKNGSRVLITSRFIDVAKSADPIMAPYELNLLDDQKSLDLLLKKALPNEEPSEELPSDLLKLANELSKICKGLPLALVVLGGILLTKDQNYHAWERVLRTMDWHSKGRECMDVLAMSYEDMPYYLKACFLYLALFPEDYQISARRLIRMWVAEGFIPQEGRITMEEIAEDYLYQLFQRSMIQVSSRHVNGLIKRCHVHDLLRDLAMHKAREENFVMVFSKESDSKKPNREIRRASFHSLKDGDDNFHLLYLEYTRSLLLFGEYGWSQIPNFRKFRLLKVLELEGVKNHDVDLVRGLEKLVRLKYLGLRRCQIPISKCSFHRMKALETLDMRGMINDVELPSGLWSIDTLRHVMCYKPFELPKTTVELKNIQTMQWVYFNKKMPLLNNLCKLGIYIPSWGDVIAFTNNLLATLPSLVSLSIDSWYLTMEVVYPKALPNYQHLQSLFLGGKWSDNVTLDASLFPPHLLKLTLVGSRFEQNPMPELGKLKSLKKLCLEHEVLSNELYNSAPIFCPTGFPVLQYFKLGVLSVKSLKVAEGAMPNLKYINLFKRSIMCHLPPQLLHDTYIISYKPFELPKTTAELKNIQTMQWVYVNKKMPLLSNLCKLGIIIKTGGDPIAFTSNLFATLPNSLVSLGIKSSCGLTMEVVYPTALPNYQHLQSLFLGGKWSDNVTLDASLFPPHLVKLKLKFSQIKQNPMLELEKLKSLKKLCLEREVLSDQLYKSGPIFYRAGFPALQYLKLGEYSVKSLTVAEGAMPNLKYLNVYNHSIKFHLPSELQHVSITFEYDF